MVISSLAEGGANVISEAVMAGVPVIASDIEGNVGLLGPEYDGFYPAGNTKSLSCILLQAETEPAFLVGLGKQCRASASRFSLKREINAWKILLHDLSFN